MKIQKINESVDWEKSMEGNNENIDRLSRLRTQVNIDPVMEEVIDETEKANKNAKDVYTKLAKGAKSITPKDPGTGKKVTLKPYTEKLALDEGLFECEKNSSDLDEDYGDYPIATMGLTNTSGIGIYDVNDEEVTYAFIDGGEKEPVKETAIIEYECEDEDSDCRPYFSVGDTKYYLDDFIRTSFNESAKLNESDSGIEYRDMMYEMVENGEVDAEEILLDLIYWVTEDDMEEFMRVRDLIPKEEVEEESLTEKKTINEYASEDEKDDFNTVLDFVDARLFGTNKQGSKPNSTNYKKTYNFLTDINVPIKGGKGRYDYALFYPDNMAYMSGAEVIGRLSRRYPMFDDGIGVYLIDEDEAVLAKAVADELNFNYKIEPIKSDKGFNYVIKIFIPESVMEMPIDKYLESIGKSLSQYKNATKKRGKKSKSEIEGA